jgi:DNA polymerase III delta prime subunit
MLQAEGQHSIHKSFKQQVWTHGGSAPKPLVSSPAGSGRSTAGLLCIKHPAALLPIYQRHMPETQYRPATAAVCLTASFCALLCTTHAT